MRITRRYRWYSSHRRTRVQTQRLVRAWLTGGFLLLALLLAAAFFLTPGGRRPAFEKGGLLVCADGGGTVELYWPEASDSALYQVEVRRGGTVDERYYSSPSAQLTGMRAGEELHIRVRAAVNGEDGRQVFSRKTLKADLVLPEDGELAAPEVSGSGDSGAAFLRWSGEGEVYEVFRLRDLLTPGEAGGVPVGSAEGSEWPLPAGEEVRRFAVRAGWRRRGFILCGPASDPVSSGGADLPAGPVSLTYRETDTRMYTLEWNGVRCERFEVQEWDGEGWETVARLAPRERMRFDAGRLGSGSFYRFRVAAVDAGGLASEVSEEVSFYASISPLHCTVWPIQDVTLYENPEKKGERLASVPGGTALCVLAEEGDWFRVRYKEEYGWVDSRFCMIDLPEYVGDHCAYDITNSYRSLFAAHNASIRQITGEVISGFENVRTEDGEFLVPYLYPCARKLLTAARQAEADGYRLKIYEAFRPQQATRFLYDTANAQRNDPAQTEDGRRTTLLKLMTDNGRFGLGSFLARTISAHNRGIALDLTLEKGGQELEMQSGIHDLSWYAATDRDNDNAKLLAGYMTGVGMNGLRSEWWHFQDDETRKAIGLNASLYKGVSAEGWTQDDSGWRYRNADGSFLRNTAAAVDGRSYTFDSNGYAVG